MSSARRPLQSGPAWRLFAFLDHAALACDIWNERAEGQGGELNRAGLVSVLYCWILTLLFCFFLFNLLIVKAAFSNKCPAAFWTFRFYAGFTRNMFPLIPAFHADTITTRSHPESRVFRHGWFPFSCLWPDKMVCRYFSIIRQNERKSKSSEIQGRNRSERNHNRASCISLFL